MQTQLFFDLIAPDGIKVHFCELEDIASVQPELMPKNIAVFELDGAAIHSHEELFQAFAVALKMPKGWYGEEEYAPNANAFLEYLDDVHEWVPAKGHIVVFRSAEQFWKANTRLAGMLVEWWQFATGPGRKAAIDPCAGDGSALLAITRDTDATLAAIEIDTDRAAVCAQRAIATVYGSVFECKVQADSCSLLYLNPPYDTELGPHHNRRMESVFLEHCYRWVRTDGVLVFVIPVSALNSCARLLASQFDRVNVFRLEHPECVRFHQIVLFGTRKKSHQRGEPKGVDGLLRAGYRPGLIPVLRPDVSECYFIPPSQPTTIHYSGLPLDEIEDATERSVAMQHARGVLVRRQQKMSGRPVTPLHKGHVGLLACSGMLNGFFGEGEDRHIAHWRAVKHVDEFNEEGEEAGETIIRKRERFSHELTLAFENGRILELKETKEDAANGREQRSQEHEHPGALQLDSTSPGSEKMHAIRQTKNCAGAPSDLLVMREESGN